MTYTHLTPTELVMIEAYYTEKFSVARIAHSLGRARQTIYNVINYLVEGHSVSDYYNQYKDTKRRCGRRAIILPQDQQTYIRKSVAEDWTPDVIIGRKEIRINCSMRTLYRQFKQGMFDINELPIKESTTQTDIKKSEETKHSGET